MSIAFVVNGLVILKCILSTFLLVVRMNKTNNDGVNNMVHGLFYLFSRTKASVMREKPAANQFRN